MKHIAAAIVLVMGLSAAAHAEAPAVKVDLLRIALDSVPSIPEPRKQARVLLAIGKAYEQAGEMDEAISVLQQASVTAEQIADGYPRSYYLEEIINTQCKVGDFSGALRNAPLIQESRFRTTLLSHIASTQAAAGDRSGSKATFAQSVDLARTLESASWRTEMLADIAVAQADAGDRLGSAATLEFALTDSIPNDGKLPDVFALAHIAAAQSKLSDRSAAAETLKRALAAAAADKKPDSCCYDLTEIARVQSLTGDRSAAKETLLRAREEAQEIADHGKRGQLLAFIAEGLRSAGARVESAGTFELARAAAKLIDDTRSRDLKLEFIAAAQAGVQYEKVAEAFDVAMRIALASLDGKSSASGEELGIQQQVPTDDLDSALATAIEISDPQIRFDAILVIAAPALATGDIESLQKLIAEGMQAVRSMEERSSGSSYMALHDLALMYLAAGVVEWPLNSGKTLAVAASPDYMLAYVSWAQAEMGDLDAARMILREIPESVGPADPFGFDLFVRLLALAQANAGEMEAAMATVGTVGDPSIKVELLVAIAVDRPPRTFWAQIHADGLDYP